MKTKNRSGFTKDELSKIDQVAEEIAKDSCITDVYYFETPELQKYIDKYGEIEGVRKYEEMLKKG